MNIFSELKTEWHPKTTLELLDCSPRALKAIGNDEADVLRKVFDIDTLSEMVNHPLIDWVWRTYHAFRSGVQQEMPTDAAQHLKDKWVGRSCGDWLGAPLNSLGKITDETGLLLGRTLGWVTIRNMAADKAFEAAREIHRIEKGGPLPPGSDQQAPLKDYFAGAAGRHIGKAREDAGLPPIPPAPPPSPVGSRGDIPRGNTSLSPSAPPPPAPSPESVAAARETLAPAVAGGIIARSDTPLAGVTVTSEGPRHLSTHGAPLHHGEVTLFGGEPVPLSDTVRKEYGRDGAYIPKGGGSRGWYENEGVAKTERMNNYGYSKAIDELRYRSTDLENQVRLNLRGAERREVRYQVRYAMDEYAHPIPALCLDLSLTGVKIRIGRNQPPGTEIFLTFVHREDADGSTTAFLQVRGEVMWCKSVDPEFKVQRYDCGLHFGEMFIEEKERLSKVLMGRVEELVVAQQAKDEKAIELATMNL